VVPSITTKTITGTVNLYDQFGHRKGSADSVTIYLNGINGSTLANSTIFYPSNDTAVTDSTGKYIFYDITEGNYNITFVKSGYDTVKVTNYVIKGSATSSSLAAVVLQATSSTVVSNLSVMSKGDTTSDTVNISGLITPASIPGSVRDVIVYIDTSASVSSTNYIYAKPYISTSGSTFNLTIYPYNLGFTSGTKLYFIAYGQPFGPSNSYRDPTTGLLVYPGLNATPSNIQTITLP